MTHRGAPVRMASGEAQRKQAAGKKSAPRRVSCCRGRAEHGTPAAEEAHLALRDAFRDPRGACFYGGNTGIKKEIAGRPIG